MVTNEAPELAVEHHYNGPTLLLCPHQIPLRTTWMGKTIKLQDFVGKLHISLSGMFFLGSENLNFASCRIKIRMNQNTTVPVSIGVIE